MKKLIILALAAAALSSCAINRANVKTTELATPVVSTTIATLDIAEKSITYTYKPTKQERNNLTISQLEQNAIYLALKECGADELVKVNYYIEGKTRFFAALGPKIKTITVKGYPATFKNFREPDENDRQNIDVVYNSYQTVQVKSK